MEKRCPKCGSFDIEKLSLDYKTGEPIFFCLYCDFEGSEEVFHQRGEINAR